MSLPQSASGIFPTKHMNALLSYMDSAQHLLIVTKLLYSRFLRIDDSTLREGCPRVCARKQGPTCGRSCVSRLTGSG
jgi:hypothetical protein